MPEPLAVVTLDQVALVSGLFNVHPVGGKVTFSNPSVKGSGVPVDPFIVKDCADASLLGSRSVPPLGLEVDELKVWAPPVTVMLGKVTLSVALLASDPVQANVLLGPPSTS